MAIEVRRKTDRCPYYILLHGLLDFVFLLPISHFDAPFNFTTLHHIGEIVVSLSLLSRSLVAHGLVSILAVPLLVFLWGGRPEMSTGGLTGKRD